jgi:hypothetical protein
MALIAVFISPSLFAHGVDDATERFITTNLGIAFIPYLYIGAKHMITGYDHILFLNGVIFFLYRGKDVIIYVSLFTLGHSITLFLGVGAMLHVNPYLIDAIIGFSIIYKGFDNLNGFKRLWGFQPNTKIAVLVFGLFHGFGLATKLLQFEFDQQGMLVNLLAFNIGVEIGQFLALILVLIMLHIWRRHESFLRFSAATNTALMAAGFLFVMYQLTGYYTVS